MDALSPFIIYCQSTIDLPSTLARIYQLYYDDLD